MAGMGLGAFLSGAAQGMQAGQRFKDYREKQQDSGSSGAAIDAAALNQPIGFGGEDYAPGQRLMESEAERGRQIEEDRQRNIESMRTNNMAGGAQPQSQGMGIDPQMAMSIYGKFAGSGSGSAAGGSSAAGGESSGLGLGGLFGGGSAAGGSAAGGSAAGGSAAGGSSAGGALAGAGPWAALAAVIYGNERSARNVGARRDGVQYWKDLIGGKVVEQDANQRIGPKLFGPDNKNDKTGLGNEYGAWAEASTLDFKNTAKKLENGVAGKLIKKIF